MKNFIALTFLLLFCVNSYAEGEVTSEKKDSTPTAKVQVAEIVDDTHQQVSSTILLLTNRIDSFFGTRRGDEEANGSRLRLWYDHNIREYDNDSNRVDLRFTLKLPQLEKLFKIKFEKKQAPSDDEKSSTQGNEREEEMKTPEEKSWYSSIPEQLLKKWNYGLNLGVKVDLPPNPYARFRLRRTAVFYGFEYNPTQELDWFFKNGVGYTMTNDLDYQIAQFGLFRLTNTISWTDDSDTVNSTHGPNLFYKISDRNAIQFYAFAHAQNHPSYHVSSYSLGSNYRIAVYSNWIYMSINPYIDWPKSKDWRRTLGINFRLEAVFGSL